MSDYEVVWNGAKDAYLCVREPIVIRNPPTAEDRVFGLRHPSGPRRVGIKPRDRKAQRLRERLKRIADWSASHGAW